MNVFMMTCVFGCDWLPAARHRPLTPNLNTANSMSGNLPRSMHMPSKGWKLVPVVGSTVAQEQCGCFFEVFEIRRVQQKVSMVQASCGGWRHVQVDTTKVWPAGMWPAPCAVHRYGTVVCPPPPTHASRKRCCCWVPQTVLQPGSTMQHVGLTGGGCCRFFGCVCSIWDVLVSALGSWNGQVAGPCTCSIARASCVGGRCIIADGWLSTG